MNRNRYSIPEMILCITQFVMVKVIDVEVLMCKIILLKLTYFYESVLQINNIICFGLLAWIQINKLLF